MDRAAASSSAAGRIGDGGWATRRRRRAESEAAASEEALEPARKNARLEPPSSSATKAKAPAEKCDQDSLSVVLSFLESYEFADAMCVSRCWYSSAQLNTAWPQATTYRSLSQILLVPQHRMIVIQTEAEAEQTIRNLIDCKATFAEISVEDDGTSMSSAVACRLLGRLRHLTALRWWLPEPIAEVFATLTQVVPQLRVLDLDHEHIRSSLDLTLFRQLRALRVSFCPPLEQLQQLTRLQFLCVQDNDCISPGLTRVIRYLSVHHCLVGVTLIGRENGFLESGLSNLTKEGDLLTEADVIAALPREELPLDEWWDCKYRRHAVVPLPSDAEFPLPPAALEEFASEIESLTPSQLETVSAMPHLVRLKCCIDLSLFKTMPRSCNLQRLAQLQHLKLTVWNEELSLNTGWIGLLTLCTNLRTLRLGVITNHIDDEPLAKSEAKSCSDSDESIIPPQPSVDLAAFLPSMPLLEELTLGTRIDETSWATLRQMQHLMRLSCEKKNTVDLALLAPIVASLPRFRSLSLAIGEESLVFSADLMAQVASSRTWCTLIVDTFSSGAWSIERSDAKLGRHVPIDPEAARRFRVHRHGFHDNEDTVSVYRVGVRADGHRGWLEV